ncbi:DsbA family protein [Noviherbaspirillum sp. CPCC 100848]|uniref:DsbA family protein n=1 Tax=Noviherbaspirillum album TaxID=3080276 RepID=A0ABU6JB63_9BURK|nr:DsbA family protein [Noviherbaspirillum sp. CPCC 100848]MEC4720889.1 DsbA family protein [Noviherbaspirillum sp. CPCC 100848]
MPSLIYIADPMCSWCYGFSAELTALLDGLPGLPVEIVVGGLRAYNTVPMDDVLKTKLQMHWQQVSERTGLSLAPTALDGENFIYNTEPACRAVVATRMLAPAACLKVFEAIQSAFYADGKDVTRTEILCDIAARAITSAGTPMDAETFLAAFKSEAAVMATYHDIEQAKRWQVAGFPTLVLEREGALDLVTSGYVTMPELVERMQALVDASTAETA